MKGSHSFSVLQGKERQCYLTGAEYVPLEKHHIYFGKKQRAISDKHGFWVYLRPEWHRGNYGVHGKHGHDVDLLLKRDCQKKYEETHSRQQFIDLVGENYLDEKEETI